MSESFKSDRSDLPAAPQPLPFPRLLHVNGMVHIERPPEVLVRIDEQLVNPPTLPLPKLSESMIGGLVKCIGWVWQARHRCLASLLLLDLRSMGWRFVIPKQRCGPDGAYWPATSDALGSLPPLPQGVLVAGSYCARVMSPSEDLTALVPAVDGLHLLARVNELTKKDLAMEAIQVFAVLRVGGVAQVIEPQSVLIDEPHAILDEAMPRLEFVD